ncbi:hypothetical protein CR513_28995, partial [Mucuna pruriens]
MFDYPKEEMGNRTKSEAERTGKRLSAPKRHRVMVDATRNQASIHETEKRLMNDINQHKNTFEERFDGVEQRLGELQELMRGLSNNVAELVNQVLGEEGMLDTEENIITQFDSPAWIFQDLHNEWISKCERYFLLDDTPEANKRLERGAVGRLNWQLLVEAMRIRFRSIFEDSIEQLMQVGLKLEIAVGVKLLSPRSLLEATKLTKLQERNTELLHNKGGSLVNSSNNKWSKNIVGLLKKKREFDANKGEVTSNGEINNHKGVLGKPTFRFQQRLTPKDVKEHRSKGFCYFYRQKYTPNHECPQKKKMQIFLMEVEDEEGNEIIENKKEKENMTK